MKKDSPSSTSLMVALGSYIVARDMPPQWLDARVARMLRLMLTHVPQPFALLAWMSNIRLFRFVLDRVMSTVIPGMFTHYVARKIFIEKHVRRALSEGCEQLIVIGGGLDTLAVRISQDNPLVQVIELDHPASQTLKRKCLTGFGGQADNLVLESADLTQQKVSDVLTHLNFDHHKKTVFVIEGVLMYLNEEQVRATLADILPCAAAHSVLIVSFMETGHDGRTAFAGSKNTLVNIWLQQQKEPFHWGVQRDAAEDFFRTCGWHMQLLSDWDTFNQSVSAVQPALHAPAHGEHVAMLRPA